MSKFILHECTNFVITNTKFTGVKQDTNKI